MADCAWLRKRVAEHLTLKAFIQACIEFDVPPHNDGACPEPGCRCKELAGQIEARAIQIIEEKIGELPATTRT